MKIVSAIKRLSNKIAKKIRIIRVKIKINKAARNVNEEFFELCGKALTTKDLELLIPYIFEKLPNLKKLYIVIIILKDYPIVSKC